MEILINAANVLYVILFHAGHAAPATAHRDGGDVLAVYFYSQPVPMLNVVAWNVFFIVLNVTQIARIVATRSLRRV